MEPCCKHNFGLYAHNKDVVLHNLYADYDGPYEVRVQLPGGNFQSITVDMKSGDEITIPKNKLNESAVINFQVFDQWGNVVKYIDDYENCPDLTLKTFINQNLECDDNNCDTDNSSDGSDGYS